jgi:hypothetical protein
MDPFRLATDAEILSQKSEKIATKLASLQQELNIAMRTNNTNARILDTVREISKGEINKIEIKFFYGNNQNYTFTLDDKRTMERVLYEIKCWLVKATKSTMARMRKLTATKVFRL